MTAVAQPQEQAPPVAPRGADVDRPRWSRVLDAVMAGGVAGFAVWTVLYEAALGLSWSATAVTVVWLVVATPVGWVVGRAGYRVAMLEDTEGTQRAGTRDPAGSWNRRSVLRAWVAGVVAVGAAGVLAIGSGWTFWLGWGLAIVALGLIGVGLLPTPARRSALHEPAPVAARGRLSARGVDAMLVLTACAVGVGSLFVYRRSADDAYYVNLSTWVVAHDHFPLRDTMFSDQVFPTSYGGGFPVTSIEGLIGSLARLLHLPAPTMAYLVMAPLLTFASIWVLGQLARLWTPARVVPVFLVSVFFVLVGGSGSYRAYSLYSIWEGKGAAIAIVLPLIWLYATRVSRSPRRHWVLMTGLLGITFIGLTSTAAILAPAIAGSLLLAAAMLGNKRLVGAAVALVIAPLLGGLAVALLSDAVGGPDPTAPAPWHAIHAAYGSKPTMVFLTMAAVMLAPLVLPEPRVKALAWSAAVVPVVLLAPGVLQLVNLATKSGAIERRMLVVPPVPTLVGALVAASIAWVTRHVFAAGSTRTKTAVGATLGAAALTALTFAGTVPWHSSLHLSRKPVWKTYQQALVNVQELIATHPPPGRLILMPEAEMITLSMDTVAWHGVAPRHFYLSNLDEPDQLKAARYTLTDLASPNRHNPPRRDVKNALNLLNVGTVCLTPDNHGGQRSVRAAGFPAFTKVGTLECTSRTQQSPE